MKSILRQVGVFLLAAAVPVCLCAVAQQVPTVPPANWKVVSLEGSHPIYSACYSIPGVRIWKYADGTGARMEIWANSDEKMGLKETIEVAFFEGAARKKESWMNFKKPGLSFPKARKKGPALFALHQQDLASLPDDAVKSMILSAYGIN